MTTHNRTRGVLLALSFLACAGAAQALTVTRLTPQGEVARVRQVVAKFDAPAVRFGDPKAPEPFTVSCSDASASRGQGRWTNEREWVYDFAQDLPPGVRCSVSTKADFKAASGAALTGTASYQFNTGGPFVQRVWPGTYQRIDEEQFFVLGFNGAATSDSVAQHVWCEPEDLGERVPVRRIEGKQRADLLAAVHLDRAAQKEPLRYATLTCARRLSAGSRMQLVVDKGVATPSGIANQVPKRFAFTVREPFTAEFTCQRENAQSACLPIRPMAVAFSAPVTRQQALALRLKGGGQTLVPQVPGDDDDGAADSTPDAQSVVHSVRFAAPFAVDTKFVLELPKDFKDASGRPLANASSFPLQVASGAMPPLAKFAAAPFGVIERFAEGPDGPALLPVTLRRVEAGLAVQGLQVAQQQPGSVSTLRPQDDADIIAWQRRLQRYDEGYVSRDKAARDVRGPLPPVLKDGDTHSVQTRMVSLLAGQGGAQQLVLPKADAKDPRPFEVVGIPLKPGFSVVEIASPLLGQSLLDARYGSPRTMYVRTSALVTNLGVHFKLGREGSLAWVTTLDKGQPVAGARVRVSDCHGKELASAQTGDDGVARFSAGQVASEPPECSGDDGWRNAYFVSARSGDDMAFVWSDWQRGIEPWRFNLPTSSRVQRDTVAHTVFDRTLLRAGETVSMKHLLRTLTGDGFGLPRNRPQTLVITHVGSGQQFTQPLKWRQTATGGLSAENEFHIPQAAKLGVYEVQLGSGEDGASRDDWDGGDPVTGQFRVEEFRLPVLEGRIAPQQQGPLVRVHSVPAAVQVNYVAGGPAGQLPVRVSAMVRAKSVGFADYDAFSFGPPRRRDAASGDESESDDSQRVIADRLPLTLDKSGAASVTIDHVPTAGRAQELLLEASYPDPSGEVQTLRSTHTLWPAAVIAGVKSEGWAASGARVRWQALALGLDGKPQAGVPLSVQAVAHITTSTRKRMVGGFYSYDNKRESKDLGTVCTGKSDSRGLLLCETKVGQSGEIELVVTERDKDGNEAKAATSVWVMGGGELWFGGQDNDRIDLLPEKKSYQPGETARFQVRMPFRHATALLTVEREGILQTRVVQLSGQDPTVEVKIDPAWSPNVYVSVLALRGRLREVPWYSFFTWGFKAPREWWTAFWYEGKEYVAPTAMVDLSKPAYRMGAAEIRVGSRAHQLAVQVSADKASYPVRGKAQVTIEARLPDGKPAAGAEVALAAVDQALLELMPNTSWNLLDAMLQRRSWGVQTATAQMEIVGRRHYGKKAAPPGGGGGHAATRELLDTLLLWRPAIQLDANGRAVVTVPLNDALTTFKIVAVADAGAGLFGTGSTAIRATQDLQIISGLPPLVRGGDQFRAQVTLRNTTQKDMRVEVAPRATLLELAPQTLDIAAGQAREVGWDVTVPEQLGSTRAQALIWEIAAHDTQGGARDALKVSQRIVPAVPLTVQQGTLVQLDGPLQMDVAPPQDALPGRGGLKLALQPKLAEGLPGVRDWWARYPFACLEQKTSKAIGLNDAKMWQNVAAQLPAYLDGDGLAYYFPPRGGSDNRGSDTLTAYILAATHEASGFDPAFALPDEARAAMESGLIAFVEGRITRSFWSPRKDLDMRKLAAIEALSRYGKATPRMLTSITIAPNQWPTHALIDWYNILQRMPGVPQHAQRLREASQILLSRLSWQGSKLIFSSEQDDQWWWLMQNGDVNTARLLLAVLDDPAWQADMGRLANGFIARQQSGAWHTTTANLWGALALEKFSAKYEAAPVAGSTRASLGDTGASVDWAKVVRAKPSDAEGAAHQTTWFGAPAAPGMWTHNTMFLPWGKEGGTQALSVQHHGTGKPWLTLQSVAAVQLKAPFASGYSIRRTVTPVQQANPKLPAGQYSRGDVLRVRLEVTGQADMTWVAVTDPVPAGATILGSGLGRDSEIATRGETGGDGDGWLAFEERSFEAYRAYYQYLPKGKATLQYTVRLNNPGRFALPPSRIEALYAPEMFGEAPNARVVVEREGGGRP